MTPATDGNEADGDLSAALAALGPWATAGNRAHLSADWAVLADWRRRGRDLGRDLLPLLARRAGADRPPPILRTWRCFEPAVAGLPTPEGGGRAAAGTAGKGGATGRDAAFVTAGLLRGLVKSSPVRRAWQGEE